MSSSIQYATGLLVDGRPVTMSEFNECVGRAGNGDLSDMYKNIHMRDMIGDDIYCRIYDVAAAIFAMRRARRTRYRCKRSLQKHDARQRRGAQKPRRISDAEASDVCVDMDGVQQLLG